MPILFNIEDQDSDLVLKDKLRKIIDHIKERLSETERTVQVVTYISPGTGGGGGGGTIVLVPHHETHERYGTDVIRLDDLEIPQDNTDLNANNLWHGLCPKSIEPPSGDLIILGIEYGETTWQQKSLYSVDDPVNLGTADPGIEITAARSDHIHNMPKLDDTLEPDDNTDSNVNTTRHGLCPKAIDPGSGHRMYLGSDYLEPDPDWISLFGASLPQPLGTAATGVNLVAARLDHVHQMPKLDDVAEPDDTTDLDVTTSKHGLCQKAIPPGSGYRNVFAMDYLETLPDWISLFDATVPSPLGTAATGVLLTVARRDHVHQMPKLDDLDAPDDNTDLNASTSKHGLCPKGVAPSSGYRNFLVMDYMQSYPQWQALFDATTPADIGATASTGSATTVARRDHVHKLDINALTALSGDLASGDYFAVYDASAAALRKASADQVKAFASAGMLASTAIYYEV